MPSLARFRLALCLVPGLVACGSWSRTAPAEVSPGPTRVQAWRAGEALELRQASVHDDSLRGQGPAGRDTALALGGIDSMRVRRPDVGKTVLVFGALVPMGLTVLMLLDAPDEL